MTNTTLRLRARSQRRATTAIKTNNTCDRRLISTGTHQGPFGFVGKGGYQEDTDSGLKLLGHRYYDASAGRFLTRDPAKDGRNWYSYCENDPTVGVDPTGHIPSWLRNGLAWATDEAGNAGKIGVAGLKIITVLPAAVSAYYAFKGASDEMARHRGYVKQVNDSNLDPEVKQGLIDADRNAVGPSANVLASWWRLMTAFRFYL